MARPSGPTGQTQDLASRSQPPVFIAAADMNTLWSMFTLNIEGEHCFSFRFWWNLMCEVQIFQEHDPPYPTQQLHVWLNCFES